MADSKTVAIKILRFFALTSGIAYGIHRYGYLKELFEFKKSYGSFLRHYIMLDNNLYRQQLNIDETVMVYESEILEKLDKKLFEQQ